MEALPLDQLSLDKKGAQEEQPSTSSSKSKSKRSGAARRKLKKERRERLPKLPQELIGHILRAAYPIPAFDTASKNQTSDASETARYSFLWRAALVNKTWGEETQRLLWEHVKLSSPAHARSFLLSAEKARHTSFLWFEPTVVESCPGALALGVLQALRGIRELHLIRVGTRNAPLPDICLCSSSFSGLKLLEYRGNFCKKSGRPGNLNLSFRLDIFRYLDVAWLPRYGTDRLVPALLKSRPRTLTLGFIDPSGSASSSMPDLPLLPAARTLEYRTTHWEPDSCFHKVLASCTKLAILGCNWLDRRALLAISPTLLDLTVRGKEFPEAVYRDLMEWMDENDEDGSSPSPWLKAVSLPLPSARLR